VNAGERGQADVTGGFGLVDRQLDGGGTRVVVTPPATAAPAEGEPMLCKWSVGRSPGRGRSS
jgi:hypothetical protein